MALQILFDFDLQYPGVGDGLNHNWLMYEHLITKVVLDSGLRLENILEVKGKTIFKGINMQFCITFLLTQGGILRPKVFYYC